MELPATDVVVCQDNRTRADLYALWLDEFDVRVALTGRETREALDDRVVVTVLDEGFADGAADAVLDAIRERASLCRVVATRERSDLFPDLDADRQLVKPVFEADLVAAVERLAARANYHLALARYYRTTIELSSFEITDGEPETDGEEYAALERRAAGLQRLIVALTREMDREDIDAVREAISFDHGLDHSETAEKVDSKYQPGDCSRCGESWDRSDEGDPTVAKLGAYVWRCLACGHVQMRSDPSHRNVSYRR